MCESHPTTDSILTLNPTSISTPDKKNMKQVWSINIIGYLSVCMNLHLYLCKRPRKLPNEELFLLYSPISESS